MMTEQAPWEKSMGLAPGSTRVTLTCSKTEREQWAEDAEKNGYSSRSAYLYDLIQEARSYREQGFLAHHDSEQRIKELEAQVDALEQQLNHEQQKRGGRLEVDDATFLTRFLDDQYQPLPVILQRVVESGALDDLIRKRVEDQLYFLASQDRVEYEPGHGWKYTD